MDWVETDERSELEAQYRKNKCNPFSYTVLKLQNKKQTEDLKYS
jgi:hypothetical protein